MNTPENQQPETQNSDSAYVTRIWGRESAKKTSAIGNRANLSHAFAFPKKNREIEIDDQSEHRTNDVSVDTQEKINDVLADDQDVSAQ